jgi:hypothetical protein
MCIQIYHKVRMGNFQTLRFAKHSIEKSNETSNVHWIFKVSEVTR